MWDRSVVGLRMFKVKQKVKWCKQEFIRRRKEKSGNARKDIEIIQREMEEMQTQGGDRNYERWKQLKCGLEEA